MAGERLWIVGPGRVGLSIGAMLHRAGAVESLVYSGRSEAPPNHSLFEQSPPAGYISGWALPSPAPTAVLIAVPDGSIEGVGRRLADLPLPPGIPVLHTSGALGSEALAPLAARGVPVGSLHPLVALAQPDSGPERLTGAWFAVEGHPDAVQVAGWITGAAAGRVIAVPAGGKALYHAAAVVASNYVVALLAAAERIAKDAGVPESTAREALTELAAGAARNVHPDGPVAALTGPIARGDAGTVERHLAELSGPDRSLYSLLARETLALAREGGLGLEDAAEVERVLGGGGE